MFSRPKIIPPYLTEDQKTTLSIRLRLDELAVKLQFLNQQFVTNYPVDIQEQLEKIENFPPEYDIEGKRTNTPPNILKEKLLKERNSLIIKALGIAGNKFQPPADFVPQKLTKKLYIPQKQYPDYKFIGLIIGPRGKTQKSIESSTGAKIHVRGKGSQKPGSLKAEQDSDDELHVFISAVTQKSLDSACSIIEKILTPVQDQHNHLKIQQLNDLAVYNGTNIKYNQKLEPGSFQKYEKECEICGEVSHSAKDCKFLNQGEQPNKKRKLINEYDNFLESIGELQPETEKERDYTEENLQRFFYELDNNIKAPIYLSKN